MTTTQEQKKLRKAQLAWIDDIMQRTGDNLVQIAEACNRIAAKNKLKKINKETLRHFYHFDNYAREGERTLSERMVFLIYKAYELEPPFAADFQYDMEKDEADISLYAKFCKQYITEVSLAKGIYRTDIGRETGLHATTISRLFNDKLPKGLQIQTLEVIRERFGVNFSSRFRTYIEQHGGDGIPVIGALYLSSDQVLLHAKPDQWTIEVPGMDATRGRVIEMKGPMYNPFVREGLLLCYNETKQGIPGECLNQTCVVQMADGNLAVRYLTRSDKPGMYRLQSLVNHQIEEVALQKASKIYLILQK